MFDAMNITTANGIMLISVEPKDTLNVDEIPLSITSTVDVSIEEALYFIPKIPYKMHEIIKAGTVVYSILLICLNRLVSVTPAAKFVESDIGDSLSPITAPEITAPAVIAGGIPRPKPIPINATPNVPPVV